MDQKKTHLKILVLEHKRKSIQSGPIVTRTWGDGRSWKWRNPRVKEWGGMWIWSAGDPERERRRVIVKDEVRRFGMRGRRCWRASNDRLRDSKLLVVCIKDIDMQPVMNRVSDKWNPSTSTDWPCLRFVCDLNSKVRDILPESITCRSSKIELGCQAACRLGEWSKGVSYQFNMR
jgi:hypothetical protein